MLRRYLIAWGFLGAALLAWLAWDAGGPLALWAADPGIVHQGQMARARREPFGARHLLVFGDSVTVVRNQRDSFDRQVFALKDLLVVELDRRRAGMEVQSQAREADFAPHFMARAQGLRRWGRWYRAALVPLNLRSLNEDARVGGFGDHPYLDIHLDFRSVWERRQPGRPLEAVARFLAGRADLLLLRGEGSALLRATAARLRQLFWLRLKLAPSAEDRQVQTVETLSPGDRVRRAYGAIRGLPERERRSLVAAGQALRDAGTRPLFYVTPLDQAALAADLPDQGRAVAETVEELKRALLAEGFEVLDASRLFQGGFFDPGTEHLAAAQRIALARWLVDHVLARPPLRRE